MSSLQLNEMLAVSFLVIGWLSDAATGQGEITCGELFTRVRNKCYFVSKDAAYSAYQAKLFCEVQGGSQALIRDYQEIVHLRQSNLLGSRPYVINPDISGFANDRDYAQGRPRPSPSPDFCVVLDGARSLQWQTVHCHSRHFVLCEAPGTFSAAPLQGSNLAETLPTALTCRDPGFNLVGEHCYFVSPDVAYSGNNAQSYCELQGGDLATIQSSQEMELLRKRFLGNTVLINVAEHGYSSFVGGAPATAQPGQCVVADRQSAFRWTLVSCSRKHYVLCKAAAAGGGPSGGAASSAAVTSPRPPPVRPVSTSPQPPPPPPVSHHTSTPKPLACPSGYTLVGTACYYLSPDASYYGGIAQLFCEVQGGNVAVIPSWRQMNLLAQKFLRRTVFIKADFDGFLNFHGRVPQRMGDEDCVVADATRGFRWRVVSCRLKHIVLCEAPAVA